MRPAAKYWSSTASACWARRWLIRYGRENTGALSWGRVILNGIRKHEPKSVFECGEDVGKFAEERFRGSR